MRYERDDIRMAHFIDNIDRVNSLADRAHGFVWRLTDENGDATGIKLFDDPSILTNMSVWKTKEDLSHFLYKTIHQQFIKQGQSWITPHQYPHTAIWPIPVGHIPSPDEAIAKLEQLQQSGPNYGDEGQIVYDLAWLRQL